MSVVLMDRVGLFASRASVARLTAWVIVGVVVTSLIVAPNRPQYFDRDLVLDEPLSSVRYVAPLTRNDLAGFLTPDERDDEFTVAWIGGSEVKLKSVSLPGEFSQRVAAVDGRPIAIDAYTAIGFRVTDTYRAGLAAIDRGADAVVVALNPTYTNDEFGLVRYGNLEVSDPTALARDMATVGPFLAFTSPSDAALGLLAEATPLVDGLDRLHERQQTWFQRLDVLRTPTEQPVPIVDDRLPDDTASFWIRHELPSLDGGQVADRVSAIARGFGVGDSVSTGLLQALVDRAAGAGVPLFLYATPLSPEFAGDPDNAEAVDAIARHWREFAVSVEDRGSTAQVVVEPDFFTTALPAGTAFFDPVHIVNAAPVADLFVDRLCAHWSAFDPRLECS